MHKTRPVSQFGSTYTPQNPNVNDVRNKLNLSTVFMNNRSNSGNSFSANKDFNNMTTRSRLSNSTYEPRVSGALSGIRTPAKRGRTDQLTLNRQKLKKRLFANTTVDDDFYTKSITPGKLRFGNESGNP